MAYNQFYAGIIWDIKKNYFMGSKKVKMLREFGVDSNFRCHLIVNRFYTFMNIYERLVVHVSHCHHLHTRIIFIAIFICEVH